MPAPDDPLALITRLAESARQVRLGPGVTSKTAAVVVALMVVWGVIVSRLNDSLIRDIALMVAGAVATGVAGWWIWKTHDLASKNPGVALLEGAELLEYEKFATELKGPQRTLEASSVREEAPVEMPPADQDEQN